MSTLAEARLRSILKGVTEAAGATGEVVRYEHGARQAIRQRGPDARVASALERAVGKARITRTPPGMASDRFSFFANEVH